MRSLILITAFILFHTAMQAQYNGGESALGLRAGGAAGVTYKKFFNKSFAFEGLLAKNFEKGRDGIMISGLFEKHAPLGGHRFSALIGGGPAYHFERKSAGINGIIGFDWRIFKSPINLQVDWSPAYYFSGDDHFSLINTAFSIRYILNRKKLYNKEPEN